MNKKPCVSWTGSCFCEECIRFPRACEKEDQVFWIIWSPEGKSPPNVRHTSKAEATEVAESMARQHRSCRFFVMKAESLSMSDGVKTTVLE